MAKRYNFVFTHNNYTEEDERRYLLSSYLKYVVIGKEVGASGTPHLQGFLRYNSATTLSAVIKRFPGAHFEEAVTVAEAIAYCKKEGNFQEAGTEPVTQRKKGELEQDRWKRIRLAAEEGRFEDIDDDVRFRNISTINVHRHASLLKSSYEDSEVQHEWYWGEAGTGKSRKAREENPGAYLKMCNKWWCGFDNEDVVIIEDFDQRHEMLLHHLKIWGDRYQFIGEFKGGARKMRPKKIIITSNYHPDQIWKNPEDLEPILRRFKTTEFRKLRNHDTS